ncbi:MAG: response regulator [Oligoflexia bacterium]|nr:response regulator [Oligoflexia bacterium]
MGLKKTDLNILVVDDDRDTRSLVRRILESRGFRVTMAEGVSECMLRLKDDTPHLAILDVELRDGNAFDILGTVKSHPVYQNIPVVLLSNHSDTNLITRAISMGIRDYLVKPVNSKVITERVEKILAPRLETRGESVILPLELEEACALVTYKTNIVRVRENSFDIVGNVFLKGRTGIEIKSSLLEKMGVAAIPKKVVRTAGVSGKIEKKYKGLKYESRISFVAVGEQINKRIRQFINRHLTGSGT